MDNRKVMQQALEALKSGLAFDAHSTVLQNLRKALAQPVQEPVAWEHHEYRPYGAPGEIRIHAILASQYMMPDGSVAGDFQWLVDQYRADKNTIKLIPLYTTPPAVQRKPLTHIQAKELVAKYGNDLLKLVFQTEAAHGIKEQS